MLNQTLSIFESQRSRRLKLRVALLHRYWNAKLMSIAKAQLYQTLQRIHSGLFGYFPCAAERETKILAKKCPENLLEKKPSTKQLDYWLSRCALDVRCTDGTQYPSTSVYQLLCGLLRHAHSFWKKCPNFLDRQNATFAELRGTCDRLSRELPQAGVGATVKHTAVISASGRATVE